MALILTGASGSTTLDSSAGLTFSDSSNQQYAAGPYVLKNRIINGGFQVWQRGTSFTTTSSGYNYTADRFAVYCAGANATWSQNTSAPTGFQYSLKMQRTASQTYTNILYAFQVIETNNCYDLSGQTVTLSFYAKAGANFSASGNLISVILGTGSGTDQGLSAFGGGTWTNYANTINTNAAITTSWVRYTFTATIPAGTNEIGFYTSFTPTGTAGADDALYITGVQLEVGSTATPFERRLYNQELANCQRYLPVIQGNGSATTINYSGLSDSTTRSQFTIPFIVTPRVFPTGITTTAASGFGTDDGVTTTTATAVTFNSASINTALIFVSVASGLTQYRAARLTVGTSSQIQFTGCEL